MAFYTWSIFYIISAVMSLILYLNLLIKNQNSLIYQKFFLYGIIASIYLTIGTYVINAPNKELAIYAAQVASSIYYISIGLFAYLTRSLLLIKDDSRSLLILMGPMLIVPLSVLHPREAILTNFGWVVKGMSTTDFRFDDLFVFIFIIFYFILISKNIYNLISKTKLTSLKRKYFILCGSFLFQFVAVFLVNALMVLLELRDIPHLSGFLYFSSLVCMWYALKIESPKEISVVEKSEKEQELTKDVSNISKSYKNFLEKFIKVAGEDELGLKIIDFIEYLDRTRLNEVVTYDKLRIIMKAESIENVDNIQALDRTIEYLSKKDWGYKLASSFIDVMESIFQIVKDDVDQRGAFDSIIIKYQEFLKSSDVVYGLKEGTYLAFMQPDDSLGKLPEWSALVRFYVRLLLPLRKFIIGPIKAEFLRTLRSFDVIKFLEVSEDGEIAFEHMIEYVGSLPDKRRTEAVRSNFNTLLTWLMHMLLEYDPSFYVSYLKTIRRIVKLNAEIKGVWRSYFLLIDKASKELGRKNVKDLVLSEGYSYADLDAFSSTLGLNHDKLVHNIITAEYDPRYQYEQYVGLAMREVLANTEKCVLFTRLGSRVLEVARELGEVELKVMTTINTMGEGIPFNDTSRLLDLVGRELESEFPTWVVFDNVSDLVLAVGFDEAYIFARRVIDLMASKGASLLLLMNRGAHSREVVQTIEGLSTRIIEIAERPRLVR